MVSTGSSATTAAAAPNNLQSLAEGLPAGWSMQLAPNGRWFFIDHNGRTTSWVDPRTGRASPMPNQSAAPAAGRKPEDDLGPLPEGWEERIHSDGRIFFIDHSEFGGLRASERALAGLIFGVAVVDTRTTQWEDPRLSNPNIAGPAIPYSRDYKRKYEFMKTQLRKPVGHPS